MFSTIFLKQVKNQNQTYYHNVKSNIHQLSN